MTDAIKISGSRVVNVGSDPGPTIIDAPGGNLYLNATVTNVSNDLEVVQSVYSSDGQPIENNLLYTPKETLSSTAPIDPKLGEYWIDSTSGIEYKYIKDGDTAFWIEL